jgi:hypothetical protein
MSSRKEGSCAVWCLAWEHMGGGWCPVCRSHQEGGAGFGHIGRRCWEDICVGAQGRRHLVSPVAGEGAQRVC